MGQVGAMLDRLEVQERVVGQPGFMHLPVVAHVDHRVQVFMSVGLERDRSRPVEPLVVEKLHQREYALVEDAAVWVERDDAR